MTGLTKVIVLDSCVDGSVDNLKHLIGDDYDRLGLFYRLQKNFDLECESIGYTRTNDKVIFDITCQGEKVNIKDFNRYIEDKKTSISKTKAGFRVNISLS